MQQPIRVDILRFAALGEACGKGGLGSVAQLHLQHNNIGDQGIIAFSEALGKGALPSLSSLDLNDNQVGDAGMSALALAGASGTLPRLWAGSASLEIKSATPDTPAAPGTATGGGERVCMIEQNYI